MYEELQSLFDELLLIITKPDLITQMKLLQRMSGVSVKLSHLLVKQHMRNWLKDEILRLDRDFQFDDEWHDSGVLQRCYLLLFKFEGASLEDRQRRVLNNLHYGYSWQTWRRPDGPQNRFVLILAEEIYSRFNPDYQSTNPLPPNLSISAYA